MTESTKPLCLTVACSRGCKTVCWYGAIGAGRARYNADAARAKRQRDAWPKSGMPKGWGWPT